MPQDPSTDPDFLKASTADQLSYLRTNDKDFAAASPQDQINYLRSVTSQHIGANTGAAPTGSPGYQYSTGYAGQNDAPRDSGGFIDRLTTQAGRALQSPSNFLPSWKDIVAPGWSSTEQAYQQFQAARQGAPAEDPAKTLGNMFPSLLSALVTHAGDAVPNPVKAAPEVAPTAPSTPAWGSASAEMQNLMRRANESSSTPTVRQNSSPVETAAPAQARTATGQGNMLNSEKVSAADRAPTPEEAANNQRFLDAFRQARAARETPNAETSIPHDIEAAQQKVFFNKETPDIDVGKKVREANPEPTRAEVKAASTAKDIPAGKTAKPVGGPPSNIQMQPAQSSTVSAHGYDPASRTMQVQFKNGNVYQYKGVPQEIFNNYKNSESQGSYHQQNIKGRYEASLVGRVKK